MRLHCDVTAENGAQCDVRSDKGRLDSLLNIMKFTLLFKILMASLLQGRRRCFTTSRSADWLFDSTTVTSHIQSVSSVIENIIT